MITLDYVLKMSTYVPAPTLSRMYTHTRLSSNVTHYYQPVFYGDNLGSIFTSNNPEASGKNKHLDVRFFKHRDYAKSGKVRVKFIGTKENVSDFFTKALLRGDFLKFRAWCMNECDMSEIEI